MPCREERGAVPHACQAPSRWRPVPPSASDPPSNPMSINSIRVRRSGLRMRKYFVLSYPKIPEGHERLESGHGRRNDAEGRP